MKQIFINSIFFLSALFLFSNSVFAEELWKSGMNLYIKTTDQDRYADGQNIPNQHPVSLNPTHIRNALNNIYIWNKSFFTGALKDNEAETVFSQEQARLLGNYLAAGFQKASPSEDILFALTRRKKGFLFTKDTTYTTGRAFYVNDKLNIIIGEFDRLGDKFKERAYASSGISEIQYSFKNGKRAKRSGFKKAIIITDGLSTKSVNGKNRTDWFVIDVKLASAAFLAEQEGGDPTDTIDNENIRKEAAKSAQERREMRLEMARLRKEMKQSQKGAENSSLEERLKKLQSLKEKKMITNEEYEAKRKEILSEI
ncbi:MAG: hypothetical protein HN764_00765 [Gammaproteobacteria bacterium]|jgi:hypothetical protein|nr:hypothetical protein [Gammaproteobacteria bacterium]